MRFAKFFKEGLPRKLLFCLLFTLTVSYGRITFPENGSVLNYTHIMFKWEQEPNAVKYNLKAIDDFQNIVLDVETEQTLYISKTDFNWGGNYRAIVSPMFPGGVSGVWSDTLFFNIANEFLSADLEVELFDQESLQEGLILISQVSPDFRMVIIDENGEQIWHSEFAYINHWNEFGQLFGMKNGRGVEVNFYDEVLWMTPLGTEIDAHEMKQISNGNYMGIVPEYQLGPIPLGPWTEAYQDLGYAADGETEEFQWRGTKIVEWDRYGSEEVWSWNPFEYFDMNDYDSLEGRWWSPINGSHYGLMFDWNHANAFHFDELESILYVSNRNLSRITKIDYESLDIVWDMGPPEEFGYGDDNICTNLLFSCQHHIQLLENGDLLFFDNGKLSEIFLNDPFPTTRIRRVRVLEDSYCETIWQYDLPQELYGHSWGSVQLLDNGNYFLYTHGSGYQDGTICTLMELSPEQQIVWKASHTIPFAVWYRSYKIPSIHPSAYSLKMDRYRTVQNDTNNVTGIIFDEINQSLNFFINNHSEYGQLFSYEILDSNGWFAPTLDTVFIEKGESFPISLLPNSHNDSTTTIEIGISPIYHQWSSIDLSYDVFYLSGILDVFDGENIQEKFKPYQNYPNPFNSKTTIKYDLMEDANIKIIIYDLLGNTIRKLVDEKQFIGSRKVIWDGKTDLGQKVASGIYLGRISIGNSTNHTTKLVLIE
ncbi:MAG: hypothetical protein CMG60_07260 [Candidatus Marinimicrobia bacterium]|nr:hypothetical protein [Candidatus Neomarinimicrobiota bacterium]|tara:strand:- start:921 stop:3041 length:2121 start_codon:yes stop_codon:yes gene_type:complete